MNDANKIMQGKCDLQINFDIGGKLVFCFLIIRIHKAVFIMDRRYQSFNLTSHAPYYITKMSDGLNLTKRI